jgi:MraZ protein
VGQDEKPKSAKVELPRGMYPGRLDDKGRLKVAAAFQRYYESLEEKTLFVTSFDRVTARIYTMAAWRLAEAMLDSNNDTTAAETLAFIANQLGSEVEMDAQGRILFNSDLRKVLKLEGTELHLYKYKDHVEVLPDSIYQEREQRSVVNVAPAQSTLSKLP